ncbi:YcaO-like family protein [Streptococcus danieliae]|uniref:YcaO-like family protein n=1 Tax=Streptococcus danieliae TaxID=747656 RepID=UPI001365F731
MEDAILHGLLEAVERDAWIIGQSNPFVLPIVDYETSKNYKIKDIISKIKEQGYDIITREFQYIERGLLIRMITPGMLIQD